MLFLSHSAKRSNISEVAESFVRLFAAWDACAENASSRSTIFASRNAASSKKSSVNFDWKAKSTFLFDGRKVKIGFICRAKRINDTREIS